MDSLAIGMAGGQGWVFKIMPSGKLTFDLIIYVILHALLTATMTNILLVVATVGQRNSVLYREVALSQLGVDLWLLGLREVAFMEECPHKFKGFHCRT